VADWDWVRIVANVVSGAFLFHMGRFSQRREDRRRNRGA
jgi:hypothetical protein